MDDSMTDPSLWKEALLCRESENILSVSNAFLYTLRALHEEQSRNGQPTEWIAHHPIVRTFAARIAELAGALSATDRAAVDRRAGG